MKFKSLLLLLLAISLTSVAQKSPEEKLNMVMYAIMNRYVDSISKAKFVDKQIERMMHELDPFSEYLPPAAAAGNEFALLGTPPAVPSDTNEPVNSQALPTPMPAPGAQMQPSTVTTHYMLGKGVGYMAMSMFAERSADDFRMALEDLKRGGMKTLVLDLQNNAGGFVEVAVALAEQFLAPGTLVFTAKGSHIPTEAFKTSGRGGFQKGKLFVLIGSGTKSAAELLAAALQDHGRATLVGQRSFGKGLIQETLPFEDGSALRLTVARYFTPKGKCIQKPYGGGALTDEWGVVPNIETAADTLHRSSFWYNLITVSGVQTLIARNYANANKEQLAAQFKTVADFTRGFNGTPLFDKVVKKADELQYTHTENDFEKCRQYVELQLKALVAGHVYGKEAFKQVMNERNFALVKVVQLMGR
ncbi:MAG TPA: S41 family peptidase [Prevotella sp.]